MALLLIYIAILGFICIRDLTRKPAALDFVVAGRNQGVWGVYASLMATMLGASATLGVAESATKIGWSAMWWLVAGAIGLLLQAGILTSCIAAFKPCSLPELAEKLVSQQAKRVVAIIIGVAWIGIVAAQFYIGYEFIKLFSIPALSREWGVVIAGAITICYTMCGGQLSVVRTDKLQVLLIFAAFIAAAIALTIGCGQMSFEANATLPQFELLNVRFGLQELVLVLFAAGGAFLLGPDVVSRSFIARTPRIAKLATLLAAISLLFFGVVITYMGVWDSTNYPSSKDNPIIHIGVLLPFSIKLLFSLGLISVLLSSANTCLINCAIIVGRDIFGCGSVRSLRTAVLVLGLLAMLLAFLDYGIIELLLLSYSIYTPGVAIPLVVALLARRKFKINQRVWLAAVIIGGACGLASAIAPTVFPKLFPVVGGVIAFVISIVSIKHNSVD